MLTRSTDRVVALAAGMFASLLAASGCGTRENHTLGVELIEDQAATKAVRTVTISPPDSSLDYQLASPEGTAGQAPSILLGLETGLLSRVLMKFDLSPLPDSGQASAVQTATARLFFDEGNGDSQSLRVTVHRVLSSWTESIASADSLFPTFEGPGTSIPLAVVASGDSADIPLTELVRFWIDHPDSNFGVALVPEASTNGIQEFFSAEGTRAPQLLATWTPIGTDSSATTGATDDTYFLKTTAGFVPLVDEPGRLAVARGIPARSLLKFDVPDFGPRATVHRAELTLFTDLSRSQLHDIVIGVQRVLGEPWNESQTSINSAIEGSQTVDAATDSVVFVITSTVANIVANGNYGIQVRAASEFADAEFVRFHAHDSEDAARRPRLKIWTTAGDLPGDNP